MAPYYSAVFAPAKNRDATPLRNALKPTLDRHSVDLVLQGYDHAPSRGHTPVRQLDDESREAFQTMYVTSVSGPPFSKNYEGRMAECLKARAELLIQETVISVPTQTDEEKRLAEFRGASDSTRARSLDVVAARLNSAALLFSI